MKMKSILNFPECIFVGFFTVIYIDIGKDYSFNILNESLLEEKEPNTFWTKVAFYS